MVTLREPDGSSLDVELLEAQGSQAVFEVDGAAWPALLARGAFHADRGASEPPRFAPSRPVRVAASLDPTVALGGGHLYDRLSGADADDPVLATDRWWATDVSQAVDVPPELQGEGELREGATLPAPPWSVEGSPLLDLVQDVLESQGVDVLRPEPSQTVLRASFDDIDVWVVTHEELHLVTAYAVLPSSGGEVVDLLLEAARMNGDVAVGSYEVDPDNGQVTFKTGIDVEGDRLSVALVRQLIGTAIVAARRWLSGRASAG